VLVRESLDPEGTSKQARGRGAFPLAGQLCTVTPSPGLRRRWGLPERERGGLQGRPALQASRH